MSRDKHVIWDASRLRSCTLLSARQYLIFGDEVVWGAGVRATLSKYCLYATDL